MTRVATDEPGKVVACPYCDETGDVYERTGNGNAYTGDPDDRYACHACSRSFDSAPVIRDRKPNTGGAAGSGIDPDTAAIIERLRAGGQGEA